MSNPIRFAIITVTFNAESCVERTIQSVLSQTYEGVDYIVVDGGSRDGTVDIIRCYADRLTRWVSEPDRGIYDGMNKGIRMAHALAEADGIDRYVLMLNADDTLYEPTTLEKVAAFLQSNQLSSPQPPTPATPDTNKKSSPLGGDRGGPEVRGGLSILCGSWMIHPEHGAYLQHPGDLTQLPSRYVICHQATFVLASVLATHPFDLRYKLAGDFEQLSRLYIEGYKFVTCPDIVISDMILNEGATERNWRQSVEEGFQIARERGLYRTGQKEWLLTRKWCVRAIKRILPRRLSNAFFGWLARHYKAM